MDPTSSLDRELLYIAKQGLMEPVPEPWEAQRDSNDMILYFNTQTGEQTHQHPCDDAYRILFREKRAELIKERGLIPVESEDELADHARDKSCVDASSQEELAEANARHRKPSKGQVTFYPS